MGLLDREEYVLWLLAWVLCLGVIFWGQRKDGQGSGLVLSYALQLWVIHWLGASIYALPWFWYADDAMVLGLEQSTFAIAGFALGSTVLLPFFLRRRAAIPAHPREADPSLVHTYLFIGVALYLVVEPALHNIPTVNAIASSGSNILLVAIGMECWNALRQQSATRPSFWRWVAMSALLPFMTVITKGFLGYGFAAMLTIFAFVATFYRPRWRMVLSTMAVGYLALSVYVTYMRDRTEIRGVVWGQEDYSARLTRMAETFANFELLDLSNPEHLGRIDERLNQNALLGLSVIFLEQHPEAFANGSTVRDALYGLVPRFLWPDKPVGAGSGDLVSNFTGLKFGPNTSVGIGHVMEWYVNFGTTGVWLGMIGLGLLVGWVDRKATESMYGGDWSAFTLWWLPGLSFLQVGGSLFEAVSGSAAAAVMALLLIRYRPIRLRWDAVPGSPGLPHQALPDDLAAE